MFWDYYNSGYGKMRWQDYLIIILFLIFILCIAGLIYTSGHGGK